jgi:hypothetical protein
MGVFYLLNFYYNLDMSKLGSIFFIFSVYILSQIFTFYQLQGHLWNKWIKDHPFLMSLIGVPIGYFVILASREMVHLYDGQTWPNRIIGFSIGVLIFSIMAWIMLKEPLSLKTIVCLVLSLTILLIQLFWK